MTEGYEGKQGDVESTSVQWGLKLGWSAESKSMGRGSMLGKED